MACAAFMSEVTGGVQVRLWEGERAESKNNNPLAP